MTKLIKDVIVLSKVMEDMLNKSSENKIEIFHWTNFCHRQQKANDKIVKTVYQRFIIELKFYR